MSGVRVLLGHHWRRHRTALFSLAGGLFLFEFLITRIAPEPSQTQAFQGLLELLPRPLTGIIPEFTANFNARGIIAFGYLHPFTVLMMSVWAVRVTAGALAGEIGAGTMDLLASRPVSRRAMVRAALVALLGGLATIVIAGWSGTAVGLVTRTSLGIAPWRYLWIALGCWSLFAAFGIVGLAVSALRHHGGAAIAVTAGLIAASFALDYVARAWQPIGWAGRFSLFTYYRPLQLFASGVVVSDALVLAGVALGAAALAFVAFGRRDL